MTEIERENFTPDLIVGVGRGGTSGRKHIKLGLIITLTLMRPALAAGE